MASNYNILLAYVKSKKDEPVNLAKALNSWEWAALLPGGGSTPVPENIPQMVNELLAGQCGWRDLLFRDLFTQIGVENRRVNFFDIPFQGNHSASEIKINGKWMFFDPSFGIYFEKIGGSAPLSIAEVRRLGPDNVEIKQSILPGWQGNFIEPSSISPTHYTSHNSNLVFAPPTYSGGGTWVRSEALSSYFGYDARYLYSNESKVETYGRSWDVNNDDLNKFNWDQKVTGRTKDKLADYGWTLFDDGSAIFFNWDQNNKYNWRTMTQNTDNFSHADSTLVVFDDNSKTITDFDNKRLANWESKTSDFSPNEKLIQASYEMDSGSKIVSCFDPFFIYSWVNAKVVYSETGNIENIYFTSENGNYNKLDTNSQIIGTPASDSLSGSAIDDILLGGSGNDYLIGMGGNDFIAGGIGNDTYCIDNNDIFIFELNDQGRDTVISSFNFVLGSNFENLKLNSGAINGYGNALNNYLQGNTERNILQGYAGNDKIWGGSENDTLLGNEGNDTLIGSSGADVMYGGSGKDTFYFSSLNDMGNTLLDTDIIMDFNPREGDKINLRAIDANSHLAGKQNFLFVSGNMITGANQLQVVKSGELNIMSININNDLAPDVVLRVKFAGELDASCFFL